MPTSPIRFEARSREVSVWVCTLEKGGTTRENGSYRVRFQRVAQTLRSGIFDVILLDIEREKCLRRRRWSCRCREGRPYRVLAQRLAYVLHTNVSDVVQREVERSECLQARLHTHLDEEQEMHFTRFTRNASARCRASTLPRAHHASPSEVSACLSRHVDG